jgi:single-stranded-DNA-specific exonuclease
MARWHDPQPVTVPDDLQANIGGHPIIARSLVRRGITAVTDARRFMNPDAYTPTPPDDLPDLDRAVERIRRAIAKGEQILVWGDFDVDGQTSTALLVSALRDLGATVRYRVPNRFSEGHGIHLPTLKTLLDDGVELVVTCDTGISAHDAIAHAQERGVDVVVTDHHALPATLPPAHALVNPMRLPAGHPLRELPGVGTAYKVMQALYGNTDTSHLLDLVAMGIVADVMVQVDDTRYLLQQGLERLRYEPRAGLRAMMARADIHPQSLTEMDIGFSLAPRLNALGRLADANPAVDLLTTHDGAIITERVNQLEGLNQKRRLLTRQVYAAAQQTIKDEPALLKYAALVVKGEQWHTGVVGIVASRLVEDYQRPVLVLAEKDHTISGSARSVAGVDIIAAIRTQAHLLQGYGGHNMAAGLSMHAKQLHAFRRGLSQVVRQQIGDRDLQAEIMLDGYLGFDEIDLDFAQDIARLAPFGNGNPPLTLATRNVTLKKQRTMGSRGDHRDLTLVDADDNDQRVVWWFGDTSAIPQGRFDIAYTVRENVFRGTRSAMVEWIDARPVDADGITVDTRPTYDIVDHRATHHTHAQLAQAQATYPNALTFVEGDKQATGVDRFNLVDSETLIVWTIPPDVTLWQSLLNLVNPARLVLFGQYPRFDHPKTLITHIIGMAKYALKHRSGLLTLDDMLVATAQTADSLHHALTWINTSTEMTLRAVGEDTFVVAIDRDKTKQPAPDSLERVSRYLRESDAYRHHWRTGLYKT